MSTPEDRERVRRLRIKAAALERHRAARDPITGKSRLAVEAGKRSGQERQGNRAWATRMAIRRWYPDKTVMVPPTAKGGSKLGALGDG